MRKRNQRVPSPESLYYYLHTDAFHPHRSTILLSSLSLSLSLSLTMPSKTQKQSKSASKLSKSNQTATSPLSLSSLTGNPDSELSEDEVASSLEAASSKYPLLISTTAFVGRLTEDVVEESKGCKIWLSETSMISSSIAPGSIVSVSLVSPTKKFSNSTPLSSLEEECARHFGFEDKKADEVGSYFALATVFPSCKVLNNGVRLSSSLQCTMGSPASGRIVFVNPIHTQPLTCLVNGNSKSNNTATDLSLHICKEIFLEFVSSKSGSTMNNNMFSCNNGQLENGKISSPRTPSFSKSKFSSPSTSQLTLERYEESASNLSNLNVPPFDSFDFNEVLGDESAKKLLQACTTSWLCSRYLLRSNFVVIPVLSKLCIFQVVGANKLSTTSSIPNGKTKGNYMLLPQASNLVDHVDYAFVVDRETKVYLHSPLNSSLKVETTPRRGLPRLELEHNDIGANVGVDFPKLGGLLKEYAVLKEIISSSLKSTLSSFGLRPTKGVLLHGPPGTGKTSLARLCAHDAGVNLFTVNGPEIVTQYHGVSEQALYEVFESASRAAPSVVFIDELDAIAPARKDGGEELSQRMVATLLNLMDGVSRPNGLLVIAATNRPDSIEPALRRPGRLDREIEIGVPSPNQRHDILLVLLSEMDHGLLDKEVQHLAMATHGFVGADLAALCNEAALVCLRRYIDTKISSNESNCHRSSVVNDGCSDGIIEGCDYSGDTEELHLGDNMESSSSSNLDGADDVKESGECVVKENSLRVGFEDFEKARMKVRPSAMREVILEVPKVNWEDVGGQKEVKMQLMEAVEWPQKHQDAFKRIGTRPPTGVLLFGPPGCSKTLLARAVASEAGLNFLAVKGPELFSKWVGESEKAVRSLFAKAKANAPSIIFFDEIDGLAVIRGKESDGVSVSDRVMSQLLVELDGLQQRVNVTVIAATNRPDKIDLALLRPGRFDRLLYVGPPNEADREDIFRIHLRKMPCSSDVCVKELALLAEGCTGADISLICREAAVAAIEESLDASEITMQLLKSAIKQVQPSEIQSYDELLTKFQRLVHSTSTRNDLVYQPCSRRGSWIPFWSFVKSAALFIYRIPAVLSRPKSSSSS